MMCNACSCVKTVMLKPTFDCHDLEKSGAPIDCSVSAATALQLRPRVANSIVASVNSNAQTCCDCGIPIRAAAAVRRAAACVHQPRPCCQGVEATRCARHLTYMCASMFMLPFYSSYPASSCASDITAFLVQVQQATTSCSSLIAAAYLTCPMSEPSGSNQKWRVTSPIHRLIAAAARACDAATMCTLMRAMACSCEPASGGSLLDRVKICARSTLQRASAARCFSCLPSFPAVFTRMLQVPCKTRQYNCQTQQLQQISSRASALFRYSFVHLSSSIFICLHLSSSVFICR